MSKGEVADLLGADARAVLAAIGKTASALDALSKDFEKESGDLRKKLDQLERACWASHNASKDAKASADAIKLQMDQVVQAWASMKQLNDAMWQHLVRRDELVNHRMQAFEENLSGLAERTAAEIIRLTVDDKKLAANLAQVKAKQSEASLLSPTGARVKTHPEIIIEGNTHEKASKAHRKELASLSDVDHWEEITHNTLISQVTQRAKEDEAFIREAARAGLGLRVYTWKTVVGWGTIIITALFSGGLLYKLVFGG